MSTIKMVIITALAALEALWLILYYGFDEAERRIEDDLRKAQAEMFLLQQKRSANAWPVRYQSPPEGGGKPFTGE